MNQTFLFTRFGRLLHKYFTDNRNALLANLGLLISVLIVTAVLVYSAKYPQAVDHNRPIPFIFIGWAAWYVFTWQQTAVLNRREQAITYLLLPASQLEKILLVWLVSGVGFLFAYLLMFTIIDEVGVSYVNHIQWTPEQQKIVGTYQLTSWYKSSQFLRMPLMIWGLSALLHPFALAFSLTIRKFTLPLVAVLAFVLFIGGMFFNSAVLRGLTGSASASYIVPFSNFWSNPPTGESFYRPVDVPQPIRNQIRYLVSILVITLLYITAYFRLKEREV